MNTRWQQAGQKVKLWFQISRCWYFLPHCAMAQRVAGWAIKSAARRPLKMLLAVALEPLLSGCPINWRSVIKR